MSKPQLTNQDFCRASKRLRCAVAAIKGVAQTESAQSGFYSDGFPVILFERHLFRKFTNGRYDKDYPEISGPPGNYGAGGANQRRKFSIAFAINPDAAMKSCSWGKFQILGSNHKVCGYNTVGAFVDAMKESEGKHLDAFVGFVIGNNLDGHLRNHDWKKFARGYNGPGFAKNKYDTKMANAFAKFSAEDIDCSKVSAAAIPNGNSAINDLSTSVQSSQEPTAPPPIPEPTPEPAMPESLTPKPTEVVEVEQVVAAPAEPGILTRVQNRFLAIPGAILAALGAAATWATSAPENLVITLLIIGAIILVGYMIINSIRNAGKDKTLAEEKRRREDQAFELQKLLMMSAASKEQNTIRLVPQPPPPTEIPNADSVEIKA